MNLPTLIVLIAVSVAFVAVAIVLIRKRRQGPCSGCPYRENCKQNH